MPQFFLLKGFRTPLRQLGQAYALMALTLASCSYAVGSSAQANTPQPLMLYGSEGSISQAEVATLKGLAWPQQYEDVVGTFGFPYYRSATADYYRISGTSNWAAVYYQDRTATGYGFENPPASGGEL